MYDEMAVNYFRGLTKEQKKALVKRLFDSLDDGEKLEIAKIIAGE